MTSLQRMKLQGLGTVGISCGVATRKGYGSPWAAVQRLARALARSAVWACSSSRPSTCSSQKSGDGLVPGTGDGASDLEGVLSVYATTENARLCLNCMIISCIGSFPRERREFEAGVLR
jgi:hypothetical protein